MSADHEILASGPRVALRFPAASDREAFCTLVVANRAWLTQWAPGTTAEEDPDGSGWFEATSVANAAGRSHKLLITDRESDALLGMLNFNEIVRGLFQSAYMGYWIGAAYARQGLMGEALAAGLGYAFGPLDLHRVEANIQPGNEPSIALVRRAGFVQEGFSPGYLKIGGSWKDHERWALTKETWLAQRGGGTA